MNVIKRPRETVARKDHMCDLCASGLCGGIARGESYWLSAIADDGRAYSWRESRPCRDLVERIEKIDPYYFEDGIALGSLPAVLEHFGPEL